MMKRKNHFLAAICASSIAAFLPPSITAQEAAEAELSVDEMAGQLRGLIYPAPVSRGASVAAPPSSLVLRSISFEFGSDALTEDAKATLNNLADAMNLSDIADSKFAIEGHTDAVGSDAANLSLSQRRAESAIGYLSLQGVDESRLSAIGMGETKLIEQTEAPSVLNRRVEVRLGTTE